MVGCSNMHANDVQICDNESARELTDLGCTWTISQCRLNVLLKDHTSLEGEGRDSRKRPNVPEHECNARIAMTTNSYSLLAPGSSHKNPSSAKEKHREF